MTEIKKRIQVGIEYGVALAIVLILWAGGVWFISGGPGPEDNFPLSFSAIVVLYLLGGIAGGAIGGALSPRLGGVCGITILHRKHPPSSDSD